MDGFKAVEARGISQRQITISRAGLYDLQCQLSEIPETKSADKFNRPVPLVAAWLLGSHSAWILRVSNGLCLMTYHQFRQSSAWHVNDMNRAKMCLWLQREVKVADMVGGKVVKTDLLERSLGGYVVSYVIDNDMIGNVKSKRSASKLLSLYILLFRSMALNLEP